MAAVAIAAHIAELYCLVEIFYIDDTWVVYRPIISAHIGQRAVPRTSPRESPSSGFKGLL